MDRREYLAAKFGNDSQAKRIYDVIRAAGESEGLEFNFDKIQQTPNTLRAHRLVRLAQERGKGSQMIEALFPAVPKLEMFARQARPGWEAWGGVGGRWGALQRHATHRNDTQPISTSRNAPQTYRALVSAASTRPRS